MLAAQETPQRPAAVEGNIIYIKLATGADTNSAAEDSRLRTLAEAARRVNQTKGTGPMTVILSEGCMRSAKLHVQAGSAQLHRDRLTIRAEVLPDDPDWHTGRMPTLIHTQPLTGLDRRVPIPESPGGIDRRARGLPLAASARPSPYRVVFNVFQGGPRCLRQPKFHGCEAILTFFRVGTRAQVDRRNTCRVSRSHFVQFLVVRDGHFS
jgi:hypothetical protein